MENPYSSPETTATVNSTSSRTAYAAISAVFWWKCLFFGSGLVIWNYLTATFSAWQTDLLMHAVFVVSPVAIASLVQLLLRHPRDIFRTISLLTAVIVILAFGVSWLPWLSGNPYEVFVLTNVYFGPYGWVQWVWLGLTGFVPLLLLIKGIRNHTGFRRLLASITILGYLFNASVVIYLSHDWWTRVSLPQQ